MICSIDVGLRNLSFCIMSSENPKDMKTYDIHLWDVYNTLEKEEYKCQKLTKNNKICNKKSNFKYDKENNIIHCCKIHLPKDIKITKKNIFKKKNIKDYLLQDIASIVLNRIDSLFKEFNYLFINLKYIVIELQPKINAKMKFTSHIIYGKLVDLMKDYDCTIRFVSASKKLKAYKGPLIKCHLKNPYSRRKWLSVEYTKWILNNKFNNKVKEKWSDIFESKIIKPDMADTFLMALNVINK